MSDDKPVGSAIEKMMRKTRKLLRDPRSFVTDAWGNHLDVAALVSEAKTRRTLERRNELIQNQFSRDGFILFPGVFSGDAAARWARDIEREMGDRGMRGDLGRDPLSTSLMFSPEILDNVRAVIGGPPKFLQVSEYRRDRPPRNWHRPSACRDFAHGLDWRPDYAVVKVMIFLRTDQRRVHCIAGSHRHAFDFPKGKLFPPSAFAVHDPHGGRVERPASLPAPMLIHPRPGDCLVLDARLIHGEEGESDVGQMTIEPCFGLDDAHAQRFYSYYRYLRTEMNYRAMPEEIVDELRSRGLLLSTGEENLFRHDVAQARGVAVKTEEGMKVLSRTQAEKRRTRWIRAEINKRLEQLDTIPDRRSPSGVPVGRWERLKKITAADWIFYHQTRVLGAPGLGRKRTRTKSSWMGIPMWKSPLELQIYQEMLHESRPDVLVEIGTKAGGSTMYFAHLMDIMGHGRIVGVDITPLPISHHRITHVTGDAAAPETIEEVKRLCGDAERVMVIHDAAHDAVSVARDLKSYAPLVSVGQYFVVEDGISDYFAAELEVENRSALAGTIEFLEGNDEFEVDYERERYLMTYNPGGFLRRVATARGDGSPPAV